MTVSISKMSIDYYLDSIADHDENDLEKKKKRDLTSYYTDSGNPAGRWMGRGLSGLHKDISHGSIVEKVHAKRIFEDFVDPVTKEFLGRRPIKTTQAPKDAKTASGKKAKPSRNATAGFDLTFSVPKSISVLWAIADPLTQGKIVAAHHKAIGQTFDWLERDVVRTRSGYRGIAKVETNGVVATSFDHWDSRSGDPQLHTHVVVANRIQRKLDGQWLTIDSHGMYKGVVAASEKYNNLIFDEIYRTVGAVAQETTSAAELGATGFSASKSDRKEVSKGTSGKASKASSNNTISKASSMSGSGSSFSVEKPKIELAGIPQDLIEHFSQRSQKINIRKDELIAAWTQTHGRPPTHTQILKLRQQATLETRTTKAPAMPLAEKMSGWKKQTQTLGIDIEQVLLETLHNETTTLVASDLQEETRIAIAALVLVELENKRSTFTKANMAASAERLLATTRCKSSTDRENIVSQIVDTVIADAVELTPDRFAYNVGEDSVLGITGQSIFERDKIYSTKNVIDAEQRLILAATSSLDTETRFLATETRFLATELDKDLVNIRVGKREDFDLGEDQLKALQTVFTSKTRVTSLIGPAGTGKTTTMQGARKVWEQKYGKGSVLGLAVSAVAAGTLSSETGINTETAAKWLYETIGAGAKKRNEKIGELKNQLLQNKDSSNTKNSFGTKLKQQLLSPSKKQVTELARELAKLSLEESKFQLRKDQLLIVDEASMVGTFQLASLVEQAASVGAKILLVGDPRQIDSIDTGGFLAWTETNTQVGKLDKVWRFSASWEAEASLRLRAGDKSVLESYEVEGRLHFLEEDLWLQKAYSAWSEDSETMQSILIVPTIDLMHELNLQAQSDFVDQGKVDFTNTVTINKGVAGVGDRIVARSNNRKMVDSDGHFIKNGTILYITEITTSGAIAYNAETLATVSLDSQYLEQNTHLGYATTAHRAQGITVDSAHCLVDEGISRNIFYVSMTRGREANHAYVRPPVEDVAVDQWGMLNKITPDTGMQVLEKILDTDGAQVLASEAKSKEHSVAHDFANLVSEYEYAATALATVSLQEEIKFKFGEIVLCRWQESPQWADLVMAWEQSPKQTLNSSIEESVKFLTQQPRETRERVGGLIPKVAAKTVDDQKVLDTLEELIESNLDSLLEKNSTSLTGKALRANTAYKEISRFWDDRVECKKPRTDSWRMMHFWETVNSIIRLDSAPPEDLDIWRNEDVRSIVEPPEAELLAAAEAIVTNSIGWGTNVERAPTPETSWDF